MNKKRDPKINQLVEKVLQARKYKGIDSTFVARVGKAELAKHSSVKKAVKATKNKLHQVGGAYIGREIPYERLLNELNAAAFSNDPQVFKNACTDAMSYHKSTNERLSILDDFYNSVFSSLPPIRSVLDLACGLNPLSIPWMPLKEASMYYAYDIYPDMVSFLNRFFKLLPIKGKAGTIDVLEPRSLPVVDLVYLLKTIPCLEQVEKAAGTRLLNSIRTEFVLVSFPIYSLSGKDKGMLEHYDRYFRQQIKEHLWKIERFEFQTELTFLIRKPEFHNQAT